ncbi:MAG TPA: tRNA (N(6)-L-threonylcarbamoyladenosine(37)-C(2))-methylthiotransferase MtaB, partial [Bacteroidales bacterium]|nr:tRNA (N(6)-L-threonylcarbamoyladenosine(37)-C(2))-methylthiotransferase MtaB [Bacteroidales bacterium]
MDSEFGVKGEKVSKRVAFLTLGCKLNYSESSSLARIFVENGYERVSSSAIADVYVVNTCSVTEHADKKCRSAIRKLHRQNPDAIIAVTGCYAQLKPEEILDIEGVDLVIGTDHKQDVFLRVSQLTGGKHIRKNLSVSNTNTIFPAYSSDDRTRSFLKVQDGCDYHCAYCTVPLARGQSRNLPIDFLVEEANEIASKGIKEIVLTGVNTGDFGKSTGENFLDLLKELEKVEGIERYRISSIEPNLLTEDIIKWVAENSKFLHHFHIPLQSGSDKILALMSRRYNTSLFREKVKIVRRYMPDAFIGVDVIVGFPGEDVSEFNETFNFLNTLRPAFIHVFPYSKRANTPAANMDEQVDERVKHERVVKLESLCKILHDEFVDSQKGKKEYVLF